MSDDYDPKREDIKTFTRKFPSHMENRKWVYKTEQWLVRVMATAEGYAMVRRKGLIPYVCAVKDLSDFADQTPQKPTGS